MNMKSEKNKRINSIVGGKGGQSLILALMVMFLLVFIGGIFVTIIVRSLSRVQRSSHSLTAEYLAEAGIKYADSQLTYSMDGADWRPVPTYPDVVKRVEQGLDPESLPADAKPLESDPDRKWLMQGFSRFMYGKGRFLVKVTYNPTAGDPMSRYIKIESVGRVGEYDPEDPTTWTNQPSTRIRNEKVAYKAIGITDYAVFITNKDRKTGEFSLGTPEFTTTWGSGTSSGPTAGAPIRVNGNLLWHGTNYIWLNRNRGDSVDVAGDIRYSIAPTDASNTHASRTYVNNALAKASADTDTNGVALFDSSPDDSTAEIGSYRDGRTVADVNGKPRNITRMEPPLLEAPSPSGGLSRYRELTRNSGEWIYNTSRGEWVNTGFFGWGRGIYLDNPDDIQEESALYTLKGNWTQPGGPHWVGPYYTPPGVSIILTPYDLNGDGMPDMILTHDSAPGQEKFIWRDENGAPLNPSGERLIMPYPQNGMIFAEGNIRIKGTLPQADTAYPDAPRWSNQLTVVSGATIYIEGSILKYPKDGVGALLKDEEPKNSAISLLAMDYVCVNTTQFFGPVREVLIAGAGGDHFEVSPENSFWMNFAFGTDTAKYGTVYPQLYARHTSAPDPGASYVNMLINYPPTVAEMGRDPRFSMYNFGNTSPYEYDCILRDAAGNEKYPRWACSTYPLWPVDGTHGQYRLHTEPGVYNLLGFQLDQNINISEGLQDYYISRVAVQPCDIRIEALLYAQEDSFFIIPGEWFNPDPNDIEGTPDRPTGTSPEWPYYGQPLDVQVTVYGAICENEPAPIGGRSAWMEKWGWIPNNHGSSVIKTEKYRDPIGPDDTTRRRGFTIVYDSQLSHPKINGDAIRRDEYNRMLAIVPRLPVSPELLYFGYPR
jgi:hypothetical protein